MDDVDDLILSALARSPNVTSTHLANVLFKPENSNARHGYDALIRKRLNSLNKIGLVLFEWEDRRKRRWFLNPTRVRTRRMVAFDQSGGVDEVLGDVLLIKTRDKYTIMVSV